MAKWEKLCVTLHNNGGKTIKYYNKESDCFIESRTRPIRHANGVGDWMYTSYFLIRRDGSEREYHSLTDAKEAAEHGKTS